MCKARECAALWRDCGLDPSEQHPGMLEAAAQGRLGNNGCVLADLLSALDLKPAGIHQNTASGSAGITELAGPSLASRKWPKRNVLLMFFSSEEQLMLARFTRRRARSDSRLAASELAES